MPVLVGTNTWKGFPFFAVMLLAAMQAIPAEIYEASRIDGANAWQLFWSVTVPGFWATTMIATLLGLIWTFGAIDLIYIITSGGPFYATFTLAMFAYVTAFGTGQYGLRRGGLDRRRPDPAHLHLGSTCICTTVVIRNSAVPGGRR